MYTKDEYFIKKSFGKAEHFRVPKGYFDTLNARVLNELKIEPTSQCLFLLVPYLCGIATVQLLYLWPQVFLSVVSRWVLGCMRAAGHLQRALKTLLIPPPLPQALML